MKLTKAIVERIVDEMLNVWDSAERWTKDYLAQDDWGNEISAEDPDAIKFCAIGCKNRALYNLGLRWPNSEFEDFLNYYAREEFEVDSVAQFNDRKETTFEDVRLFVKCLKDKDPNAMYDDGGCTCDECR